MYPSKGLTGTQARADGKEIGPEQIEGAVETFSLLSSKYNLREVLGHDDISSGRRADPGPKFPMSSFRTKLVERPEDEEYVYETSANLNIHTDPGTQHWKGVHFQKVPMLSFRGSRGTDDLWKYWIL